ncbi:hypothetical protein CC78DRAFT_559624 [Lojkania enalia]|uniref:DNA polymerase delta subunit 4 n=1 Tax=Lojkania enalia TaxID=147567 RepID=A0A9P4N159_9PLEO|nr:hypothetical protein CC78DRAFT_559624 [Didymosphaeria enalia]
MPPKRRARGATPKAHQSTLAFHGTSNRVTKPGARAQNAKKNLLSDTAPTDSKDVVADISPSDAADLTTADAAVVEQTKQEVVAQQVASTPEEDEARKISKKRIDDYWRAKERAREAPRVHQEDLSTHEKILREFDMSGQYGPCTGTARLKRWKRAQRLGLTPPIEVLAVLLKEQDGSNAIVVQRSHVDELLNSRSEALA